MSYQKVFLSAMRSGKTRTMRHLVYQALKEKRKQYPNWCQLADALVGKRIEDILTDYRRDGTVVPGTEDRERVQVQGPLKAYRFWSLADGVLHSVTWQTRWEGPTLRASCPPELYDPDNDRIGSATGIYCFKSPNAIEPSAAGFHPWGDVCGEIEISGRVVECENGYRAELATIQKLYVTRVDYEAWTNFGWMEEVRGPTDAEIAELEERYQCPVDLRWGRAGDTPPQDVSDFEKQKEALRQQVGAQQAALQQMQQQMAQQQGVSPFHQQVGLAAQGPPRPKANGLLGVAGLGGSLADLLP
jgi:hypothetical protein